MSEYWENFFQGPFAISDNNADALTRIDDRREFVKVTGSQAIDSGVREYTTETRNGVKGTPYVSSAYTILIVGDHTGLVVKGNAPLTATGQLKLLPAELPALIFPDDKDAAMRSQLYPVMLDTDDDYRVVGYVMMGALALYGLLLWIYARRAWSYVRNISTHPVVKRNPGLTPPRQQLFPSEK